MHTSQSDIIDIFRNNPGGIGSFLSDEQKRIICAGRGNKAENNSPYDQEKLLESVDIFFQNHPIEWLEIK